VADVRRGPAKPDLDHASGGIVFTKPSRVPATLAALGIVPVLLLAGCAGSDAPATSTPPTSDGPESTEVKLLTYDSYNISKSVLKDFTAKTGYEVKIVKAEDAVATVNRALLTKENPEADVLFGIDNNTLGRALDVGLFQPYEAPDLAQVPQDLQLDPEHRVTPIDTGDVCLNYDRATLSAEQAPKGLEDLTGADFKDDLVVENPATSTPGLAFLLATIAKYGEDGYLDYWTKLKDNGVKVEDSWDNAYYKQFSAAAKNGTKPIVVSYASSPAAEMYYADPQPEQAPTAAVLNECYNQIEFAGVLNNAANPTGAEEFINFMLTRPYQEDIMTTNWVYSVLPSVQPPAVYKYAPAPQTTLSIPFEEVNQNREQWVEDWTSVMQ